MSGRRIDDRKSWIGNGDKTSIFPMGAKSQMRPEVEGAGELGSRYPDTDEQIVANQKKSIAKVKARPLKDGYRN